MPRKPTDLEISTIRALRMAHDEIVMLRRELGPLRAQNRVLEVLERALFGQGQSQGMGEDPVWAINNVLKELNKVQKDEA